MAKLIFLLDRTGTALVSSVLRKILSLPASLSHCIIDCRQTAGNSVHTFYGPLSFPASPLLLSSPTRKQIAHPSIMGPIYDRHSKWIVFSARTNRRIRRTDGLDLLRNRAERAGDRGKVQKITSWTCHPAVNFLFSNHEAEA